MTKTSLQNYDDSESDKDDSDDEALHIGLTNGKNNIKVHVDYFDKDNKIKSEYVGKLHKQGVRMASNYYNPRDIDDYHMIKHVKGNGSVSSTPDITSDEIIQSVLFNNRIWTVEGAEEWLLRNGLHAYEVDKTAKFHRFRQVNPSDIPTKLYHYVTHKIDNKGIDLIIALRKTKPIKGKSLHTLNRKIRASFKHTGAVLKKAALTVATPMIKEAEGIKSIVTNPKFVQGLTTIGTPILSGLAGAAATFATGNPLAGMAAAQGTEMLLHKAIPKRYYSNDPLINGIAGVAGVATDMATGGSIVKRGRGRPKKGTGVMINNVEQLTPSEVVDKAIRHDMDVRAKYGRELKANDAKKVKHLKNIKVSDKKRIKLAIAMAQPITESFGVRMARLRALKKAKV